MPMPGSLSSNMSKLPAIEVTPDENGNFMIGGKGEFAFFLDWLSGGYNACIGGDYANGQGALYLSSSGVIAFDPTYNAKDFAVTFSLNEDGSISFKCPHEGGTLSFAYTEADGYYFTANDTPQLLITRCISINLMSRRPPNSMSISAAISARLTTAHPSA